MKTHSNIFGHLKKTLFAFRSRYFLVKTFSNRIYPKHSIHRYITQSPQSSLKLLRYSFLLQSSLHCLICCFSVLVCDEALSLLINRTRLQQVSVCLIYRRFT